MHNDGDLDDTKVVYVGKVCRLQERDQEDPESRAGRLARDRDHHAQVIKKVSKMMTLPALSNAERQIKVKEIDSQAQ